MKFTTVATDAFQKFQLNAGILTTSFDPASPTVDRSKIFAATSGGAQFTATPEFIDFGDDVDNVPANTKEMKVLQSVTATLSGTFKTVDANVVKRLMAAADISTGGKVTPRADLSLSDFFDLWWVGDYSDENTGASAGFIAIHLMNALSTGGLSLQPNDKGKGDFAFTFTGHYSINDMTVLPYEVYVQSGTSSTSDATLSALVIADATLSPTFDAGTTQYEAETVMTDGTVTATATDSGAGIVIIANGNSIANGDEVEWEAGENVVTIMVSNGDSAKTYKVIVTKE